MRQDIFHIWVCSTISRNANTKNVSMASWTLKFGIVWTGLKSTYTPVVKKTAPSEVMRLWSEDWSEALRDCFEFMDWQEASRPHGEDINTLTHCITDCFNFWVENTVPTKKVRFFSNNKPWMTPELNALKNEKKRAFRFGDKEQVRWVKRDLKFKICRGKESFKRKMEEQLQQNKSGRSGETWIRGILRAN